MAYACGIEEREAQWTVSTRTRTSVDKLPEAFDKWYGEIYNQLTAAGQASPTVPYAAYHNMDMQDLDVEIGWVVDKAPSDTGEFQAGKIEGGRMATCVHVGAYGQLSEAYGALMQWMAENRSEGAGVAYEFYLNDPSMVSPEELQTQIVFPLK